MNVRTRTDDRLPKEHVFGYTLQEGMEIRQRLFVLEIREARSYLKLEFVASTCSKLLERASLAGFQAGKQEAVEQAANPSVARWKNGS